MASSIEGNPVSGYSANHLITESIMCNIQRGGSTRSTHSTQSADSVTSASTTDSGFTDAPEVDLPSRSLGDILAERRAAQRASKPKERRDTPRPGPAIVCEADMPLAELSGKWWGSVNTDIPFPTIGSAQGHPDSNKFSVHQIIQATLDETCEAIHRQKDVTFVQPPRATLSLFKTGQIVSDLIDQTSGSTGKYVPLSPSSIFTADCGTDVLYTQWNVTIQRAGKQRPCAIIVVRNPTTNTVSAHCYYFKKLDCTRMKESIHAFQIHECRSKAAKDLESTSEC